jgi:PAS domain S-box-containing protein
MGQAAVQGMFLDIDERKKAQESVRKSEARYRELANFLPEMVFETDLSGKITFFNQRAFEIAGFTPEELAKGVNMLQFVVPQEREKAKENIKKALSGEEREGHEYTLYKKNDVTYPAIVKTSAIISENKIVGLRGIVIDITESKNAVEEIRSLAKFPSENPNPVMRIAKNNVILYLNNAARFLLTDLKAETGQGALPELSRHVSETLKSGLTKIVQVNRKDRVFLFTLAPEINAGYVNVYGMDITDQKKAEEALRQERDMLESVAKASGAGLVIVSKDYHVLWANDFIKRYKGDTIGKLCYATLNSLNTPCSDCGVAKIYAGKTTLDSHEYCSTTVDGNPYWVEIVATPLTDGNGNITSAVEICVDITERKKTEEAFKTQVALIDLSPDAIIVKNRDEKITFWNTGAEKLYGYTKEEALGQKINILLKVKYSKSFDDVITQLKQGKSWTGELTNYNKNNNKVIVQSNWSAALNAQGDIAEILESNVDITQRKNAEDALKESEERLRAIVANSPVGIATSGADKRFLSANEAFCRILGYTEAELQKLTFKDITHSEDLKASAIKMGELGKGKISSFTLEKRYVKKDGTVIYGKIMVSAVRNQNGKPSLFVAELEDATDRKVLEAKVNNYSKHLKSMVELRTAQLKDANERLVKSERLAAIGELAGMVGHDLRNPLTGIKNAAYFLKKKGTTISEAQAKEMLEIIDKAIDHSNKIINDLLDYSREMHLELTKYAARTLVDEAKEMIQVPDRIQIVNHVHEKTWIWVDADKMMRVFINLIKNAIDAMPEKGTLEISSCQAEDCVEITFADTGTGISEETLHKIFTPLFTTKAQGMGFGLAICKRIIEAHGGTITVKTAVNKGTTFTITLPKKSQPAKRAKSTVVNINEFV